ncbi:NCOA6-like protein, partial [Mya arenaria]
MGPQEDYIETVFTCEGDFHDPHLKDRLEDFKRSLKDLLLTDKNKLILKKVEPWNSVKVTFKIPREAAIRLKQLAQQGNATLKELGVLAVQIQDQNISLTIAGKNNEHTQLVFRTADSSQATTPTVSVIGTNSPALDGLSPQGPGPGPNLTEKTSQNIAEYLRQLLPAHIAEAQKAKNNFMPFPGFEPGKGSSHPHASVSGYQGNATSMSPSSNAISPGQSTMGGPSGIRFPHAPGMPPGLQPGLKQALDNLPPPPPYPGEGSAHQNNIQKLRLGPTTPSTLLVNLLEPAFAQLLNAGKLPPGLDPETMKPAKKKRKPRQPKEKKEKKGAQTVSSVSGVSMPTTTMGIPSATVPSLASARLMNSDLNPSVTESGFHNVPQALLHNTSVQKRVPLTSPVTHGRKHDEDTAGKIINPVTGVLEPVDLSDTSPAKSDGDKNSPRSLQGQKKPSLGELKIEDLRRTPNLMGRPQESVRPKTDTKSDVCSTSQSRMMNMTPEERQIANNVKEILKKAASETLNRKSPKLATPGHNSVPHRSEGNHNAMQGAEVSMPKKKSSPRNSPRNPGSPRNPSSPRGGASPRTSDGAPSPHQAWQFHPNQDLISAHLAARESQSKSPMRDSGRAPLMEQRRSPFNMLPDLLPAQRLGGHVSSETVPQPGEVLEALSMRPQCNMDNIALLKSLEAYAHPHLNQLNMMAANKDPALIQKIEELRPLFKLHKQMSVASAAVNDHPNTSLPPSNRRSPSCSGNVTRTNASHMVTTQCNSVVRGSVSPTTHVAMATSRHQALDNSHIDLDSITPSISGSTPPVLTAVSDIPETKPQSNATDSTILELSQPSSSSDNGNAKESEPVPDLEELTLSLVTKAKEKHQMSDLKNDKPLEVTNEKPVYDDSEFSQTNANSKTKSSRKRRASSESVEDRYDEHDPKPRQLRSRKRPNPNDQEIAQPEDAKRQKQDTCADTVQKVEHKDIGKSTGLKAPTPTSQLNDSNKCNEELSTNSQHESIKSGLRTRTNSKTSQPTEVQEKAKGPIGRDGRKDGKGTPSKSAPEKKVEPVKPEDGKRPPPSRRNRQSPSVQPQERALSQPAGVRERSPQRTGKTRGRNSPLTVENMEELSHDNKRTTRSAKTKDAKVPDPPPPQPASKAATASAAKRRLAVEE